MTGGGLLAGVRAVFWGVVYVGTVCAAILAFAPAGSLRWVALVGIVGIVAHDAHVRFADGSGALDG